jgi:hypothetical protein
MEGSERMREKIRFGKVHEGGFGPVYKYTHTHTHAFPVTYSACITYLIGPPLPKPFLPYIALLMPRGGMCVIWVNISIIF